MSTYAIVPVKGLQDSKTRLSELLNPQERQTFTLTMLEDVLKAVAKSASVHRIIVVSSDPKVQEFVENLGFVYLCEMVPGLNQAVEQAMDWCVQNDAGSVLVLPADIPLITSRDVNMITGMCSDEMGVVIAPSRNGGTNALLQKPPNLIRVHFGQGSFKKHLAEASGKGLIAKVYYSRNVAMDIDSPEDLQDFVKVEAETTSHLFLRKIGLETPLRRRSHDQ